MGRETRFSLDGSTEPLSRETRFSGANGGTEFFFFTTSKIGNHVMLLL